MAHKAKFIYISFFSLFFKLHSGFGGRHIASFTASSTLPRSPEVLRGGPVPLWAIITPGAAMVTHLSMSEGPGWPSDSSFINTM